jgi:hypothetical protein
MSKPPQLQLTDEQVKALLTEIKADVVRHLITRDDQFDFYQSSQVAGILNVNAKTLSGLPIPKYPLAGGKIIFYRLSEVEAYLQSNRE